MKLNKIVLSLLLIANILPFTACGSKADTTENATSASVLQATAPTELKKPTEATPEKATKATPKDTTQNTTEAVTIATPQPTEVSPDTYSAVDTTLSQLCKTDTFKSSAKDEQIAMVQACLQELETNGLIQNGSIVYTETHYSTFSFKYINGADGSFTLQKTSTRNR